MIRRIIASGGFLAGTNVHRTAGLQSVQLLQQSPDLFLLHSAQAQKLIVSGHIIKTFTSRM